MFNNVGQKIKSVTTTFCWIGIVLCVIGGLSLLMAEQILLGLIVAIAGSLLTWLSSLAIYAIGSIEDNLAILTEIACENAVKSSSQTSSQE